MTDSTVTNKTGIKPDHLTMEEWVESRIARQLQIEIDADPHHYRIKGFTLAVAVDDRQAVIVLQLQPAAAGTDLHPLLAVDGL